MPTPSPTTPNGSRRVSGLGGDLLSRLLPLLAPIVMSYLARKLGMGGPAGSRAGSGDILGDLLGGILGGGAGSGAGGGLGDILGQILGGGQPADTTPAYSQPEDAAVGDGSGGVFNAPESPGGMQIPMDDTAETYDQVPSAPQQSSRQQPAQGSGDILGDLLGQILGR